MKRTRGGFRGGKFEVSEACTAGQDKYSWSCDNMQLHLQKHCLKKANGRRWNAVLEVAAQGNLQIWRLHLKGVEEFSGVPDNLRPQNLPVRDYWAVRR
ncbi:hypothetical protein V5799_028476 [Amblyomma americanum]|uniref:Uncharacterized protein n=1 Tax=Amblyomma americanum TaxID=6943 RepID=A0AAQ4DCR6_AMBAM